MIKARKDLIRDKKIILFIGVFFILVIVFSLFLCKKEKNTIDEKDNLSKLTEEYNKKNNNKVELEENTALINENNSSLNTDIKEDIINSEGSDGDNMSYYSIGNIADLSEDKANTEATDFAVFVTEKINNDEIEDLYNILNKEYINTFNYTQDKFEFNYFFNGDVNIEVTNVEIPSTKDRLFLTTKIVQKANGAFLVKDFTIFDDGSIADILIKSINNLDYEVTIDNVNYKISKRIDTRLGAIYKIDIVNNSENLIQINDMLIENKNVIYSYEIVSDNEVLESYPGINFSFMIKVPNNYDIDYLVLKCIDFNGEPYDITILDKYNKN